MTTARPSSSPASRARELVTGLPGRAADRLRQAWVRNALDGVVAVVAFLLAQVILRQPTPIFAPIAAVVCLTDSAEKRGQRAVRLLLGVVVGVAVAGRPAASADGGLSRPGHGRMPSWRRTTTQAGPRMSTTPPTSCTACTPISSSRAGPSW